MREDARLFLLVLDLDDTQQLEDVFGDTAVAGALEALEVGFSEIGAAVLSRHERLPAAAC